MARAPQHPAAFADIKPILDAAIAAGGGAYRPKDPKTGEPSREAAIRWRHRAYSFRRAIRHQAELGAGPFMQVSTPYDGMALTIEDSDPTIVWINKQAAFGQLLTLQGDPLDPQTLGQAGAYAPEEDEDPLIEQARRQAHELGLEK